MAKAPVIRVENLRCGYGERIVLDQISFEVSTGEVLALPGRIGLRKIHADEAYDRAVCPHGRPR